MNEQADKNNKINTLTVVLGAGESCNCDLSNSNHHYVLIDARSDAIDSLNEQYGSNAQITTRQACVTPESGRASFYHYSLPEFSSTLKSAELTRYLPGLTVTGNEFVSGITLSQLVSDLPHAKVLQLALELPGQELALLQSLKDNDPDSFNLIDTLTITTSEQRLYEQGNTNDELATWLEQQGYELSQSKAKEFSMLEQTWQVDKKQLQINALIAERDEAIARASRVRGELNKKLEESEKQFEQAEKRAQKLKSERDELQKKLEETENYNKQIAKLNKHMDYMFEQQRLQLEQATNALGSHITETSSRQASALKARLSLEQTYGRTLIELDAKNSNIDEVRALALTNQLYENSYDIIIEFGAGKSTEFLVSALVNYHRQDRKLVNKPSGDFDREELDLPQHLLSFEHSQEQYKKVKERIGMCGLETLIDLRYTPLIPSHNSQELFYDCQRALSNVASLFDGRGAKALIVINHSETDVKPSYGAALEIILNNLSALQLDIIASDATGIKNNLESWQKLMNERGLATESEKLDGIYLLRINS